VHPSKLNRAITQ